MRNAGLVMWTIAILVWGAYFIILSKCASWGCLILLLVGSVFFGLISVAFAIVGFILLLTALIKRKWNE